MDEDRLSDDKQMADLSRNQTQTITDSNADHTQKSTSIRLQLLGQDPRDNILLNKEVQQWNNDSTQAGTNTQHRKYAPSSP